MKKKLAGLSLAVCALLAGLAVYFGGQQKLNPNVLQSQLLGATLLPAGFKSWPDIDLKDQHGDAFEKQNKDGKWRLVFFGYTHCPDICPMTMTTVNGAIKKIEKQYREDFLQVVFTSVDPQRDTPDHLRQYMAFFNPDFLGLSPDTSALKTFTDSLNLIYKRIDNPDNPQGYLMDHTASMMLFDEMGEALALFTMPHEVDNIASDLIALHSALGQSQ